MDRQKFGNAGAAVSLVDDYSAFMRVAIDGCRELGIGAEHIIWSLWPEWCYDSDAWLACASARYYVPGKLHIELRCDREMLGQETRALVHMMALRLLRQVEVAQEEHGLGPDAQRLTLREEVRR